MINITLVLFFFCFIFITMIKLKKKDTISKILSEKKIRNSKILLIRINRRTKNKTKYYSLT